MGKIVAADYSGPALLITAIATLLTSGGAFIMSLRSHKELKTLNEGTVGTFTADAETRRVEAISHDERTAKEQRHLDEAPPPDPPQGPPR